MKELTFFHVNIICNKSMDRDIIHFIIKTYHGYREKTVRKEKKKARLNYGSHSRNYSFQMPKVSHKEENFNKEYCRPSVSIADLH